MAKLSRRQFIRLSSAAAAGVWAARYGSLAAQNGNKITLNGGHADVWAWQRSLSGTVTDLRCQSVTVTVNQTEVMALLEGDRFYLNVPLVEGDNTITAACQATDGKETMSDPLVYTGKLRDVPTARITVLLDGDRIVLDGSGSQPAEQAGAPIVGFAWGETVTDEQGRSDRSETYFVVKDGKATIPNYDIENPAWVENTVVYGVIPRNFGSEGFQSIIDRLDYLKDLGVNALWLAPINQSPPGDYGYAVVDYFDVDKRYGTKDDFRRMVQAAHERGIRVLMDFVPNHSSEHHPYFQDALRHGQQSPYWNFYDRDDSGMYTYYFNWTHLPNLNYENPEVRRWMLEAFSYWVREFDVDGFRVDVAWGIRERRPDFWPEWRRTLKRIKPDLLLLAEASARDEYYFDNGYDAAYDWTAQLGHWAWELVFEDEKLLTFNLHSALTNRRAGGFHPDALIFRFLNNNDTGPRFITKYGLDMTRVATALLLTLPGIPCVYTGDEVGEAFQPYSDPAPLVWKDQYGLLDYHKKLIALRRGTPSLYSRHWTIVDVEPHQQVYGYLRHLADGSEPILVLLNFSSEAQDVEVTLPETFAALAEKPSFDDLLSGETITPSGSAPLRIRMQPSQPMILR
ncbi:MAG: alpha-amylase [Chloroflexi bacterium]|nr:alpha-amylase [Chloroflexota bacterium]